MEIGGFCASDNSTDGLQTLKSKEEKEMYMKLKAVLFYNVGKISESHAKDSDLSVSKKFIAALTETTWKQFEVFAEDLEHFAKHAKRTTVGPDDVKLLARRSQSVSKHLSQLHEEIASKASKKKSKIPKLDEDNNKAITIVDL